LSLYTVCIHDKRMSSPFEFTHGNAKTLEIKHGLVVPSDSIVTKGLPLVSWPTVEQCNSLFKQLFGIRKKKIVQEDDEEEMEPVVAAKVVQKKEQSDDSDESEHESESEYFSEEDDEEHDDDDDDD